MKHPRVTLLRFFVLSAFFHAIFFLAWPESKSKNKSTQPIEVSFLPAPKERVPQPAPEESRVQPARPRRQAPTRPTKSQAQIAKKESLPRREPSAGATASAPLQKEFERTEPSTPPLSQENPTIVQRPLPTLKELLPPAGWSERRSARQDGPVHLETRDPQYVTYFTSIKRAIELSWQYPQQALRYGLQGKLLLEFTVSANGELDGVRLLRSSGHVVLDDEALRAIKAASPFHPIPPWIGRNRIDILASFEYLDNRLYYRFGP